MKSACLSAIALLSAVLLAGPSRADPASGAVRIGVLTDETGMLADMSGPGSVEAARMAVEDFGPTVLGVPIKVLDADHQNKPDIGVAIARRWFDTEGVDMITDLVNSSVALAVQDLGHVRGKITIPVTPGAIELVGAQCSPTGALWVYDTYATSVALARSLVASGYKSWFFIAADYAFGHSMVGQATREVRADGGTVAGIVYHPQNAADFSNYLLAAQYSHAQVIGLANAANDLVNSLKQAHEFGIDQTKQRLAATIVTLTDIHAMGLATAQGLTFLTGFYWDMDDQTRAWSQRFFARRQRMPTMFQAGMYSAVLHYLKAVQAAGTTEGTAVMAAMRRMPVEDMFARHGHLREDGRMVHDMYIAQVKTPEDSHAPWDYYRILQTIPGDQAFRPLSESDCPLLKR